MNKCSFQYFLLSPLLIHHQNMEWPTHWKELDMGVFS